MQYIDKMYFDKHVKEVIDDTNKRNKYDSPYIFDSAMIVSHPQKRKHNCIKITLINTNNIEKNGEKFNVYIDDYEIIKVSTLIRDFPIYECEESAFAEKFYSSLLMSYLSKMIDIHGEEYYNQAVKHRKHSIDLYTSASKEAIKQRNAILKNIDGIEIKSISNQHKIERELKENFEINTALITAISNQQNIINYLDDKYKTTQPIDEDIF